MEVIAGLCFIALALTIWFKTNAFVEYMELFKLERFFHIKEYVEMSSDLSYPEFLKEYFNSFITRLLSCPICTSVWLGFFVSVFAGLLAFPIVTFFGLSLHLLISKLL